MESQSILSVNLPPFTLYTTHQQIIRMPEAEISIPYTLTNNDTVGRTITTEAISAQSIDLDVSPPAITISAGASQAITITGTLGNFPEGTGDIILLRISETSGNFTDLLGATLIDTAPSLGMGAAWRAY